MSVINITPEIVATIRNVDPRVVQKVEELKEDIDFDEQLLSIIKKQLRDIVAVEANEGVIRKDIKRVFDGIIQALYPLGTTGELVSVEAALKTLSNYRVSRKTKARLKGMPEQVENMLSSVYRVTDDKPLARRKAKTTVQAILDFLRRSKL